MPKTSKSYKKMMAEILKSNKTVVEKIEEKKVSLNTPSAEPSKLNKI